MTKTETLKLLAILAGAYPRLEVTPAMEAIWTDMLGDVDAGAVMLAARQHIATSTYPPAIAEIRKLIVSAQFPTAPAEAAWLEVSRALTRARRDKPPTWSSALLGACVDALGGWARLCDLPEDQVGFERAAFLRIYATLASHAREEGNVQSLRSGKMQQLGDVLGKVLSLPPKGEAK